MKPDWEKKEAFCRKETDKQWLQLGKEGWQKGK